jgi:microcystin-dependent protein
MANVKISELPVAASVDGASSFPVVEGGVTKQVSKQVLLSDLGTPTTLVLTNATDLPLTSGVAGVLPVANGGTGLSSLSGEVKLWPTNSPPSGYLLCNGAEISRATYAALFAVIGTTFGSAGPTTFTLPNYNNRMPIGAGGLYALGATGGSKDAGVVAHDHTYSATTGNQSADHTHSGTTDSAGAHSHTINRYSTFTTGENVLAGGQTFQDANGFTNSAGAHTHTFTTGGVSANHNHSVSGTTASTGSSGTDANLPPYLAINFIIKT